MIEIKADPLTVAGYEQLRDRIQQDIFQTAAKLGLMPNPKVDAFQIHIGLKQLLRGDLKDPASILLLRNFIVDFINHSEIASGILDHDPMNSPPLSLLVLKLYAARIRFLSRLQEPIARKMEGPVTHMSTAVHRFYQYVTESDLSWKVYRALMPQAYQSSSKVSCLSVGARRILSRPIRCSDRLKLIHEVPEANPEGIDTPVGEIE